MYLRPRAGMRQDEDKPGLIKEDNQWKGEHHRKAW